MGLNWLQTKSSGIRAAAIIQLSSKYLNAVLQLVITMVLARILTPAEYGIVAMVTVFVSFFSLLTSMGIGPAVIQYRDLTDDDCNALMSFTAILGVLLALAVCAISVPVGVLYGEQSVVPMMCLASVCVVFHSVNMVPNGVLVRDKKFLAVGVRLVVVSAVSGGIAIGLACLGFGAYALIWNNIIVSAGTFFWNYLASRLRFGNWHFVEQLKVVGRFSLFQFLSQFTQYLIRNLDTFLIGTVLGSAALGFYDKGYRLAKYPAEFLPGTMSSVLKTFFADYGDDMTRLFESYFKVQKVMVLLSVPVSVGFFFAAEEIILLMFGDQWVDSIALFRILSVSIVFQVVNFSVFAILEGAKRTDYLLAHTLISGVVMTGLLIGGLVTGDLIIVTACVTVGFVLYSAPKLYFVIREVFHKSIIRYLLKFAPEVGAGALLAVVLALASAFMPSNIVASLVLKIVITLAVYLPLIRLFGQWDYVRMAFGRKGNKEKC